VLDFMLEMAADPTILSADGLHFTPSGRRVYAARIVQAVEAEPRTDR